MGKKTRRRKSKAHKTKEKRRRKREKIGTVFAGIVGCLKGRMVRLEVYEHEVVLNKIKTR